jgi:NADH-quinone oxidoreductase subunit J
MFEQVLFWLLGLGCVGTASMVILPPVNRRPVHAAIALVISFFFIAGIYVLLLAHLMAVLQVLVYAGAIMVLFLFVIMLLNLNEGELGKQRSTIPQAVGLAAVALIGVKFVILLYYAGDNIPSGAPPADARVMAAEGFGTVESVGHLMFTQYLVPFELTGILLLVAIIGALVLAKRTL